MTEEIKVIPTNGTSADDVKYAKRVEEIYIDGVDVAGCNAYKEGHCLDKTAILLCDTNKCSNYNDCYYKQLKRLEQERDELKKTCEKCKLFDIEKTNRDLLERIDKLKQENKDLKKQIESDKGLITVGGKQQYEYLQRINELEQENKELKIKLLSTKCYLCGEGFLTPEGAELYEEKNKYRSALEEIRENLVKLKTNDEDDFTYEYSKIEDKINECLGE